MKRLWTGGFGASLVYMQVFIFRNNCEVVKLLNVFHHKVFSVSFVIVEKKTTVMKSLSIYFGHHS